MASAVPIVLYLDCVAVSPFIYFKASSRLESRCFSTEAVSKLCPICEAAAKEPHVLLCY